MNEIPKNNVGTHEDPGEEFNFIYARVMAKEANAFANQFETQKDIDTALQCLRKAFEVIQELNNLKSPGAVTRSIANTEFFTDLRSVVDSIKKLQIVGFSQQQRSEMSKEDASLVTSMNGMILQADIYLASYLDKHE